MLIPDATAIAAFLSRIPLFTEVSAGALHRLSGEVAVNSFRAGECIFRKGADGGAMFVIYAGRVRVHDGQREYREQGVGECFGEYSLIDQAPRSASVTAVEESILLHIPSEVFIRLVQEDPGFSRGILGVLIKRHRQLDEVLVGLEKSKSEIEAAHAQNCSLIEGAMDAIVLFDVNFRIRLVNPAACGMLQNADVIKRNFLFFLDEEGASLIEDTVARVRSNPGVAIREYFPVPVKVIGSEGRETLAEGTISSFAEGLGPVFTLILRNIEDRVRDAETIQRLTKQADYLEEQVRELTGDHGMIAEHPAMQHVRQLIDQVAGTSATVLVTGETGTGKELVARAIHQYSSRRDQPMIRINCGAIPASLIESELFGHEKGAFTGAANARKGRFLLADGGTLFLDEIGELPTDLQPKLLRVIQEGEFEPLGSTNTVKVDVRIVAATHRDLKKAVARGTFREDLYYRLHVFPIRVPPLRERGDDILLLARHLIRSISANLGRPPISLAATDEDLFKSYNWPGNVRELQNLIERGVILANRGKVDWQALMGPATQTTVSTPHQESDTRILTEPELEALVKSNLLRALNAAGGKISGPDGAAAQLGIPPSTLASRLKTLGLTKSFPSHEISRK